MDGRVDDCHSLLQLGGIWRSYEGVANDAAFHKLVTEMHGFSELMSRNITVETDL